jgi:hypothetical protein
MTAIAGDSAPVEVHLPDGGHIVVGFSDATARAVGCDLVVELLLRSSGSEREIQRAIVDRARAVGLTCNAIPGQRPTVIVISPASPRSSRDLDRERRSGDRAS